MSGADGRSVRPLWGVVHQWLASAPGVRFGAIFLLAAAGLAGFILHESLALGWPLAREEAARFDAYHLVRSLFAATAAALLVTALATARAQDCALNRASLDAGSAVAATLIMAGALAATGLLVASPSTFHDFAREDSPLEWASALLLLSASGLFALKFARELAGRRSSFALVLAGLLGAAFLVLGMEEISWMQRIIGFGTPESLAEVNWQAEFNLHNIQTDLSELVFYAGAGLFLSVLPLLRDLVSPALARHPLADFVPGRGVAAVAASAAIFTFGQWNLLPVQAACWLALLVLSAFAHSAWRRGDGREAVLFAALAVAVAAGQALVLAYGSAMIDLPDASEYKELFIAFAFAWYAAAAIRADGSPASA